MFPNSGSAARRIAIRATVFLICLTGCYWQPPVPITLTDLGATIQRFELVYDNAAPQGEDLAYANRSFDRATFSFFFGDLGGTIRGIEAVSTSLRGDASQWSSLVAASLKLRLHPHVGAIVQPPNVTARVSSVYPVMEAIGTPIELVLRIRNETAILIDSPFNTVPDADGTIDVMVPVSIPTASLEPRNYFVELVTPEGVVFPMQRWAVVRQPIQTTREQVAAKLGMVPASTPQQADALAACRARSELLLENPSEDRIAEYIADPSVLEIEVPAEADQLLAGQDPYARRSGDYWRVLEHVGEVIPYRVYFPSAVDPGVSTPLLIAFHGYGGDENLFFEGYGLGRIKSLADQHGMLVVTPFTFPFLGEAGVFDRLLEAVRDDYNVDSSRVYLLGHSLGAAATVRIAAARADLIAAIALLAGGGDMSSAAVLPPTLAIAAQLDPIAPPEGLREAASRAAARGQAVEFRELANLGHTIMVGAALPHVFDFLNSRQLSSARSIDEQP